MVEERNRKYTGGRKINKDLVALGDYDSRQIDYTAQLLKSIKH